jgi:putative RecB family exonuclease
LRNFTQALSYPLSASKLQVYQRCPQAYYFRHELGLKQPAMFGSASLGTALHQALARFYWDWHYQDPLPSLAWMQDCWTQVCDRLTPAQGQDGSDILNQYYTNVIAPQLSLCKPLAVEGRIQGYLQVQNLEFTINGRYDRLDWLNEGLELVDYKSGKEFKLPELADIDVQMGLYYLALEQRYQSALRRLSLIHLRSSEVISYEVTPDHKARVLEIIQNLAWKLQVDDQWQPTPGSHCGRCGYRQYCPMIQAEPDPLPPTIRLPHQIQLSLSL